MMSTASSMNVSTLGHLFSKESQTRFRSLCEKWSRWRISESEHKWLDLTDCQFLGNGNHEIAVFTFDRHLRVSRQSGDSKFPVWFAAGPHWSDRWHDADGAPYQELPLIGIVRGLREPTGFVEPLRVLAVISCSNAQFVYDETLLRLARTVDIGKPAFTRFGNPRCREIVVSPEGLLAEAIKVLDLPCPAIEPIDPNTNDCVFTMSIDDLRKIAESQQLFVDTDCDTWGSGNQVVYAYTFKATQKAAYLASEKKYAIKIGWTAISSERETPAGAAASRIASQLPFAEPVQVLGLLRSEDGHATETQIHRQLASQKIRCLAKEWFVTNSEEVRQLMTAFAGRTDDVTND